MKSTAKTNQFLRVVMFLSRGAYITPKKLAAELEIEERTLYRYIEDLKASAFFKFEKRGKNIRISRDSLFWTSVMNIYLTDEEAHALSVYLDNLDTEDAVMLKLREKMHGIVANYVAPLANDADTILKENITLLQSAITEKRLCILRGYTSLNSNTVTDRLVEPFNFLGSKNDVRCYELSTQQNKTFKVSRCKTVEVLEVGWQFEERHKEMFTDIFHFSDENKTRVRLLLGNLAKTILVEEYPQAEQYLIPHPDGRWMLDAEYCSMKGIGRFYLGLFEDIEIVDSPEFTEYITERIHKLCEL